MVHSFKNDYSAIGHKLVLEKLLEAANEQNDGYFTDNHTKNAIRLIQEKLGKKSDIYFVSGGTLTNNLAISKVLRPYEAVICAKSGHINVHETGIVEGNGHKILTVEGNNGKIVLSEIDNILKNHMPVHTVLPKMVYISLSTELGSVYEREELIEMYNYCKEHDLYLYLDGARLASGMAATSITFSDLANYTDMFYIGLTKCGGPLGEALVINNKEIAPYFDYAQKRFGALLAKGFVVSIPFEVLMKDDIYLNIGKKENELAMYLCSEMKKLGYKFYSDSKTNQIFPIVSKEEFKRLEDRYGVELWEVIDDNTVVIRFVVGFETNLDNCKEVIEYLKKA